MCWVSNVQGYEKILETHVITNHVSGWRKGGVNQYLSLSVCIHVPVARLFMYKDN